MANVFGILSTILLLFGAFVAFKNKEALEQEISVTNGKIEDFKSLQKDSQQLSDEIAALEEETSGFNSEEAEAAGQLATQLQENAGVQTKIDAAERDAATKEAEVARANDQLKELGDIPDLIRNLKATQAAIARLSEDIASNEANVSQLESTKTSTTSTLDSLKEVNRIRRQKEVPENFEANIRSVYRNWGFVTIGAGDNDNVMKDSVLQVTRNGQTIGKIKVTAVEANTAAANIIADSVAEGESINSGDRVSALPAEEPTPPATPSTEPDLLEPEPADPAIVEPAAPDEPATDPSDPFGAPADPSSDPF